MLVTMENKCLNVIKSSKKQVSTVNAVGQFLPNNERERFELWDAASIIFAPQPSEE